MDDDKPLTLLLVRIDAIIRVLCAILAAIVIGEVFFVALWVFHW